MDEECVLYEKVDYKAYITLNRPDVLNAISPFLPQKLCDAVQRANQDDDVHVIILQGEGRVFCAGYDMNYATGPRPTWGSQDMPWDPYVDYTFMNGCNECWMSIWKSLKPVICKIQGFSVGGGSDIALCCDYIVMADDAKIGYPPVRVWGCPTSAMWVYRVGLAWAKRILLTGDLIDAETAERINLVNESVPLNKLDEAVESIAERIGTIPKNQLAFQKLVINQAIESMGLISTQRLATFFDGMTRHSPEGVEFQQNLHKYGVKNTVKNRDFGNDLKPKL